MLEKYRSLRRDFLSVVEPAVDSDILSQLKHNYAHEIFSRRKLSQTKNLEAFIRLLEKRDIIGCDNIEQLWFIAKYTGKKPELENKFQEYENWLATLPQFPYYNMYYSDNISIPQNFENATGNVASSLESHNASASTHVSHGLTVHNLNVSFGHIAQKSYCSEEEKKKKDKRESLQQALLLEISKQLGRSWRDVARYLGVRECEIDVVQNKYPYDLKEQSLEILKIYMSQSNDEQWAINLIQALEKGRRRDLKELVEKFIVTHRDI